MTTRTHNIGVAAQIGSYSDAVEAGSSLRWLFSSGTPGLGPDGTLPDGIEGQATLAWQNVRSLLAQAGMNLSHLIKITQYLTRVEDIPAYAKVRNEHLGDMRPASMLLIVPQLVRPEFLLEIEIIAAKSDVAE